MDIVTLSSKGQIVIPEGVRKRLGLAKGDKLVLFETRNGLLLQRESDVEEELERWGWMMLAEESLKDIWDNEEDEHWNDYL